MSLTLHPDVDATSVPGGLVLLHRRAGRYWQLNATAAAIVEALLAGRSHPDIARHISTSHAVAPTTVLGDIATLSDELRAQGLVV